MKNFIKSTLVLCLLIIVNSCSENETVDVNKFVDSYQQNPDIAENIILIEEERTQIVSTDDELANGIYSIEFSGDIPLIGTNDIIIGSVGDGFLRQVTSVSVNGNTVKLQTTQANMEAVFKNANIKFTTDITENSKISASKTQAVTVNYMASGVSLSGDGLEYDISNTKLYDQNGLTFQITNGTVKFDPNFNFKADYSLLGGLDYLSFGTNNATLNIDCDLSLDASNNLILPKFSKTLADFDKKITFKVRGIPVVVKVNTKLVAELDARIDAKFSVTSGFTNNYTLTSGVKYDNDNWTGNFNLGSSLTPKPINFKGQVNIARNLSIIPRVSVKFYGVIGPYCEPKMTEDFVFNVALPSLDWDSNLKVGLDLKTGVDVTIFGKDVADFSRTDRFEEIIWNAPESLKIVSGNNQEGTPGQQLTKPLKVLVKDKLDNALSFVPVHFTVVQGGGTVVSKIVMTDKNGFAEVLWTLGDNTGAQTVDVTVKKADGTNIKNSPKTFNTISSEFDTSLLIGTWKKTGETENGIDVYIKGNGCDHFTRFNETQIIGIQFLGNTSGECYKTEITKGTYTLEGNKIIEKLSNELEIIELSDTNLTLKAVEGSVTYIMPFERSTDIIGTWKKFSETKNGAVVYDSGDCDLFISFNETQMIQTQYSGENPGECNLISISSGTYTLEGNIITEYATDGQKYYLEIMELTDTRIVFNQVDAGNTYRIVFTR